MIVTEKLAHYCGRGGVRIVARPCFRAAAQALFSLRYASRAGPPMVGRLLGNSKPQSMSRYAPLGDDYLLRRGSW